MGFSRALLVWLCLCTGIGVQASVSAAVPSQIRLASEEWSDYTEASGRGMGWDILREVFQARGVKLEIHSMPYTRSVGLVQRGEVDALVGSYREEVSGVVYPRWNYDTDHIYALGLASRPAPTLADLDNYRLVWVRGYKYQDYLPNVRRFNEIRRGTGILPMLQYNRADYYVDGLVEVKYVLAQAEDPTLFKSSHLAELPLFLAFADNAHGRELLALFDQRMAELVKNGRLRPIFERWKQPYPFESNTTPAAR